MNPNALDHVALWVADRDPLADFLCGHLGMHVIDRTERFTLVGADAREGKLTLFAAEPPRDPGALAGATLQPGEARAYVEVHIEQGPYLESVAAPVGVVTAIAGQSRILTAFTGEAGHAGTVAMHLRRDPVPAAAEIVLAAEDLARQTSGLLTTVGTMDVTPGASNVIAGQARFSLDIRHPEDPVRAGAVSTLERRAREVAATRSLGVEWRIARDHPAIPCDASLTTRLAEAAAVAGLPVERLPSGAGHDSVMMSEVVPVAMLFVRCAGGISHHPAESVKTSDVAAAIDVLDRFVTMLANEKLG
jgi:hydantoinase/carbamoylase family amidase